MVSVPMSAFPATPPAQSIGDPYLNLWHFADTAGRIITLGVRPTFALAMLNHASLHRRCRGCGPSIMARTLCGLNARPVAGILQPNADFAVALAPALPSTLRRLARFSHDLWPQLGPAAR